MPRKAFVADLREATEACASGDIDVHNLRQGDDDGDFIFKYGLPSSESLQVEAHVSGEFHDCLFYLGIQKS